MGKYLPSIQIKSASIVDLEALFEIESKCQMMPWSKNMLSDSLTGDHLCWKMVSGEDVLGFLVVMRVLEQLELLNIVISPSHQKQGLGSLLMDHLIQFSKENQISSTFLEVRRSNISAIRLYLKYGFEQIGGRKNYYACREGREDALVMQLSH